MGALFVKPLPYTVVSANQNTLAPASNANLDEPALVWRSNNLTTVSVIIDLGASAGSYDTVALVGSNLRAADTVQVQTGTTTTGTGTYAGSALAAYSGTLAAGSTTKAIYKLASTRSERYVRLDLTATSHPDGYTQVQRIVIGKALSLSNGAGVDLGAEQGFVDQSVSYNGPGWASFDEFAVLPKWKFTVSMIGDTDWRNDWFAFMQAVGKKKAFLFVPDDTAPTTWQTDALFGRITSDANSVITLYGLRRTELVIVGLAQ